MLQIMRPSTNSKDAKSLQIILNEIIILSVSNMNNISINYLKIKFYGSIIHVNTI